MFYVVMGMIQLTKSGTIRKERCLSAFNNFLTVLIKVQKFLILLNVLTTCKTTQCVLYHISIPILSEVTIFILNSFKVAELYNHNYNTKFLVLISILQYSVCRWFQFTVLSSLLLLISRSNYRVAKFKPSTIGAKGVLQSFLW